MASAKAFNNVTVDTSHELTTCYTRRHNPDLMQLGYTRADLLSFHESEQADAPDVPLYELLPCQQRELACNSEQTWQSPEGAVITVSNCVDDQSHVTTVLFPDGSFTSTSVSQDGQVDFFDRTNSGVYIFKRDGECIQTAIPTGKENLYDVSVKQSEGSCLLYENVDITYINRIGAVMDAHGNNQLINGRVLFAHKFEV